MWFNKTQNKAVLLSVYQMNINLRKKQKKHVITQACFFTNKLYLNQNLYSVWEIFIWLLLVAAKGVRILGAFP